MKHWTVTGAAGFLGSHLCERLVARGDAVLALDNLSTGSLANLDALYAHPRFRFIEHDIVLPLPDAVLQTQGIFNLACPASPAQYQPRPVDTLLASTLGVNRLLEAARASGARLLQASTSEVYGDPLVHPQAENYRGHVNPIGPRACYDEGKRCAEALCMSYNRQHGVSVRIARIFNSYGPRLQPGDGRVVSNFVVQALQGRPLTIHGSGSQTRSFCFVDDTIDGLLRLMDAGITGPVNIGATEERTVLSLAERILALTHSRSALVNRALPEDDPCRRRPDITMAMKHLGWQPRVALDDGLQRTIEHFRGLLATQPACA